MNANTKFWLVWNGSTGYTHHRHLTEEAAIKEAGRLAGENTGCTFYVLQGVCIVRPASPPIEVIKLHEPTEDDIAAAGRAPAGDGIPF